MEDTELIARTGRGDRDALGLLYDRHARAVYSFAWMLTQSIPDSEDVTQEVFLALARKPRAFDPARSQARTWLLAVARNHVLRRRRRDARKIAADSEEVGFASRTEDSERMLLDLERADAVQHALAALPSAQREALYLVDFEGLSLAETAAVLEIEGNAVKSRLFRARERMKRLLRPLKPALSWKGENTE
ncbi:MAG TPA: sigma-70 family RNA polymerase sigma factor [Bryobacteraceae bacterium]|jgi:RNA polymerase sigma-70 factor (ECF subfamily)|nr:sigma-70 family RNA polymerase sigma factor [Bryobacteraceae bacterium]